MGWALFADLWALQDPVAVLFKPSTKPHSPLPLWLSLFPQGSYWPTSIQNGDYYAEMGHVTGAEVKADSSDLDLSPITAHMRGNHKMVVQGYKIDIIDNQLESLAWLANELAE